MDSSDSDTIAVSLLSQSASSSVLQAISAPQPKSVMAGSSQLGPREMVVVSSGMVRGGVGMTTALTAMPKMVTMVVGSGGDAAERRTR